MSKLKIMLFFKTSEENFINWLYSYSEKKSHEKYCCSETEFLALSVTSLSQADS